MPDEDKKSRENSAIILLSDMYKTEVLTRQILSGDNPVNPEAVKREMLMESGISKSEYRRMNGKNEVIVLPENLILENMKIGYNKGLALKEFLNKYPSQLPETGKEYDQKHVIETQKKGALEKLMYGRYNGDYIKEILDQNRQIAPAITVTIKPAPEDVEQTIDTIDSKVQAPYTQQPNDIKTEEPPAPPVKPEEIILILEESHTQEEPPAPHKKVRFVRKIKGLGKS